MFCLLHKMDLIDPARREELYKSRVIDLQRATREGAGLEDQNATVPLRLHCFATSIWDATLYRVRLLLTRHGRLLSMFLSLALHASAHILRSSPSRAQRQRLCCLRRPRSS